MLNCHDCNEEPLDKDGKCPKCGVVWVNILEKKIIVLETENMELRTRLTAIEKAIGIKE